MSEIAAISFIVATRGGERWRRCREQLERLGARDLVVIEQPNSIYQAYDVGASTARHEALCFLHDDVDLVDLDAALVRDRLADPSCGFLGVAGTQVIDESAVWWRGAAEHAPGAPFSGRCGHRQPDRSWISEFGPYGRVVVLDGACLFTTKQVIHALGGFADPPLEGFDFYDLSVTLRAHRLGLVNATIPVELYHWSLGRPRPSWDAARLAFLKKYGPNLPCALPGVEPLPMSASPTLSPASAARTAAAVATYGHVRTRSLMSNSSSDAPASSHQPVANSVSVAEHAAGSASVLGDDKREPTFELFTSRQFLSWLDEQDVALALTTYQAGKLFLLGRQPDGQVSVCERTFNRCMGLWGDGQTLWMSTLYQLWRFENILPSGAATSDGFDRVYVPQLAYTTGDIDIHDLAVDRDGRVVFTNTLFSCLAEPSPTHSFVPLWRPPFVSRLAAEDRCHLNGLALRDGRPAYVTCVSQSDVADGWRDRRRDGGVVVDVVRDEVAARGLSMPHSPRWYRDRLWLLSAGTGFLGYVEQATGTFVPVAFCPGYLRGLAFVGDFAVVGSSKARENRTFQGLELDANLRARDADARCGVYVIDLRSGDLVHFVRMEGVVDELYDVVVLPGVRRPKAVGLINDEIRRTISIG